MRNGIKREQVQALAAQRGIIMARDVAPLGVSPSYLNDLVRNGTLCKLGRGMFALPNYDITNWHSLVEVASYCPNAIICLSSALCFHEIGTQLPNEVWVALPNSARAPKSPTVPVQVVRMSAAALAAGVETHKMEGVDVRVFSPAKTVADCFKCLSSVGLWVAIEALKDVLAKRQVTVDALYEYAKVDRVWHVMRPYLEALVHE